ncbi:MAG: RagB/SusD family nutrient uptake outer membrane protein [Bacteroidota bacterium]
MKKITTYSLVIMLTIFSSCSFLDENPTDRLVVDNFYSSAKDAQGAVDATYAQLNSLYNRLMYMLCDLPSDDHKNGLGMPNPFLQNLEFLRIDSQNTFVKDMWTNCYAGISRANAAIENIPKITMDATLKNRLIGEAKFLRALYYFNLVRFFGDVPLITKLETINDAMGPRISKDKVYQQIIDDLTFAEANLPLRKDYSSKDEGRATKGAAKILLGKVYLTKGDFAKAKDKLAEVVESESIYGYGLQPNYADNWNPAKEAGIEAVFYLEFKKAPFPNNGAMGLDAPKYSIPGGNVGVAGSNEADIPTRELYDQFNANDTRRSKNFKFNFTNPVTGKVLTSSIPLFGKYWLDGVLSSSDCDVNMHVIRYADAILMYAEALNETGDAAKALTQLNRVRTRAFGDANGNFSAMSKDEFRKTVINERRLEFVHEGHRWFDLVRTGTFVQRMKEHSAYEARVAEKNKTEIATNVKDAYTLMPIPQREIDLNSALTQNPGY